MNGIAVVIPCFNHGRVLDDAVTSVLRQSRAAAEMVIVDDGSTDLYTRDLLASSEYPNTRIVRTSNGGGSAAKNHGIRLTSADYVVTLDAGNRLDLDFLARAAARLDRDADLGFILTGIQAFGAASYEWIPQDSNLLNVLICGAPNFDGMFRRCVWDAVGGFDESPMFRGYENLDFWLAASELGMHGELIKEPLLEYRVRSDSLELISGGRLRALEAIFQKHLALITRVGESLVAEKHRFLQQDRNHHDRLTEKASNVDRERQEIEAQIAKTALELMHCGIQPLEWGDLGEFEPLGPGSRGIPLHISYVRAFLQQHAIDLRGDVLLIQESECAELEGILKTTSDGGVKRCASITELPNFGASRFDCVIAADVCRSTYDVRSGLFEMKRILKPNGILLCYFLSIRAGSGDCSDDFDYWRFTEASVRHLCAEVFPVESLVVRGYGNVLVCAASLLGLASEDIEATERDFVDPMFPLVYCIRGVKAHSVWQGESS